MNRDKYNNIRCCVCHHALDKHIDEGDGWRCHCLATDFFQCECWLRKTNIYKTKNSYNQMSRIRKYIREIEKK